MRLVWAMMNGPLCIHLEVATFSKVTHYQARRSSSNTQLYMLLILGEQLYGVALWHQLRCVDTIRIAAELGDIGDRTQECFNYLR